MKTTEKKLPGNIDSSLHPPLRKIAFIYTELQKNIFNAINENKIDEFILLHPSNRQELAESRYTAIISSDQNLNFKKSKSLKKEIKDIINDRIGNNHFELWLASCDNPIGQLLINHPNCKKTILIEDGIGSYVKHTFMDIGKGWRSVARKIKYIIMLLPHYRSYYGIGSHKADEYWALHETAFPRANRKPNLVNTENLKLAFSYNKNDSHINNKTVLYLDQPLIRNNIIDSYELNELIRKHITHLESKGKPEIYLIKAHPVSTIQETLSTAEMFSKNTRAQVIIMKEKVSIESAALSPNFNPLEIFSFISSALYTIKALRPDLNVSSITTKNAIEKNSVMGEYISAMNKIGIHTKTYR